jgi:hypothetical protein
VGKVIGLGTRSDSTKLTHLLFQITVLDFHYLFPVSMDVGQTKVLSAGPCLGLLSLDPRLGNWRMPVFGTHGLSS